MSESHKLTEMIEQYIAGDSASGDVICATLEVPIRHTIRRFLAPQDAEVDDVVQDVLIAMLQYLRKAKTVPDRPEAFVATIAKNRCCSLHLWRKRRAARDVEEIAETTPINTASPLELLDDAERNRLLAETVRALEKKCRKLLIALYREETTVEELRTELGLQSVQAVYHRRNVCIKKAQALLNRRLLGCHPDGGTGYDPKIISRGNKEPEYE
jgi:RNA polymerase sigma factor (sigma-70 family)